MALTASGSFDTSPYSGAGSTVPKYAKTDWSASFNETSAKWDVSYSISIQGGRYSSSYNQVGSRAINIYNGGTLVGSGSATNTLSVNNNSIVLTGGFSVAPNSDGSLSLNFQVTVNFTYDGANHPSSGSQTFSLPSAFIPSKVVVSNSAITISSTSGTVGYTVSSSGDYYHKIAYGVTYDSASVIFASKLIAKDSTYSGTINYSDILSLVPTASGNVYVYVDTYKDSDKTQKVGGTTQASINATIDTSTIKPTLTLTNITATDTPISGYFVAGYSSGGCSGVTATPGTGSVISRIDYTVANGTIRTDGYSVTGSDRNLVFSKVPASASNYTVTLKAVAYDQRGAASAEQTKTVTVYGYELPKITTNIYRVANSGDTEEDYGGEYVRINYTGVISSSVNGQNSVQSTVCTSGSTTYQNNTYPTLGGDYSATYKVVCTDKVASATATINVNRAIFPMSLYDDLEGDVGVIFGGWTKFHGVADMDIPLAITSGGTGGLSVINDSLTTSGYSYGNYTSKTYTVNGNGFVIVSCTTKTDDTDSYGITVSTVRKNNTMVAYATDRIEPAVAQEVAANAVVTIEVKNGDTIFLGGFSTKVGTKTILMNLLCFGCTVTS